MVDKSFLSIVFLVFKGKGGMKNCSCWRAGEHRSVTAEIFQAGRSIKTNKAKKTTNGWNRISARNQVERSHILCIFQNAFSDLFFFFICEKKTHLTACYDTEMDSAHKSRM